MMPKTIHATTKNGQLIHLTLYPETPNSLWCLEEYQAAELGEGQLQTLEGFVYEYTVTEGYQLAKLGSIVYPSQRDRSGGRLEPGLYVGTLLLPVVNQNHQEVAQFPLEVRSVKTSYRDDYRLMLEEIAEQCTGLLLQSSSPAVQRLTADYSRDPDTNYQRFAFLQAMLLGEEFEQAVHRITAHPTTAWSDKIQKQDLRKIRRLSGKDLRRLASGSNRFPLPAQHPLRRQIDSLPMHIESVKKERDLDTAENRFIKHALSEFMAFCTAVRASFEQSGRNYQRSSKEALALEEQLADYLNRDFFRKLSYPTTLPLNSPVLQRKEGYRYILKTWLLFDLAARLIWSGGDNVYQAGKRDVAQLYEYWLFFKLKELITEVFSLPDPDLDDLFVITNHQLDLNLKAGKQTVIKGKYHNKVRPLAVEFSYNRSFKGDQEYPNAGSWTRGMRPDYTLSLWPADINKETAEQQELITHIHFDAKYRVNQLREILGEDDQGDGNQGTEFTIGFQSADLLKMHAYRDAIRRTAGAYILYPGTENEKIFSGFHEIIPGLGAFAVRPSQTENGTDAVKEFLTKVADHLLNRAAQRDRFTYHKFEIFKGKSDQDIKEPLPEFDTGKRSKPPQETYVLVGYCKSEDHYQWILETGFYNFRLTGRGAIAKHVDPQMLNADFLLLHGRDHAVTGDIFRIKREPHQGPIRMSKREIQSLAYPNPNHDEYLVFQITPQIVEEFSNAAWDLGQLSEYSSGRAVGIPFAVTLSELMRVKHKPEK